MTKFSNKTIADFDNIFDYLEWMVEYSGYYCIEESHIHDIEYYIRTILEEKEELDKLLSIAAWSMKGQ